MFKKKSVLFHTEASIDQAHGLLEARTVKGSPMPDHPIESLKDTLRLDEKPFRGEIGPAEFKLTRRRRGRNVRIRLEGQLRPKPDGGTEIHATMSPPKTLWAGVVGGLTGVAIVAAGALFGDLPVWVPAALALANIPALALAARMYESETSRTFSALRDAIPARVPQAVAPVSAPGEAEPPRERGGEEAAKQR